MFGDVMTELKKAIEERDKPRFVNFTDSSDGQMIYINLKTPPKIMKPVFPHKDSPVSTSTLLVFDGYSVVVDASISTIRQMTGWL